MASAVPPMTPVGTRGDGRLLAVFPLYPDNPWHEMVYLGLRGRGDRVSGVGPFFSVDELTAQLGGELPDTVHLGWSTPVTQVVPDVVASMQRVLRFVDTVRELRALGVRVVWTVHNVVSHESHHVTPELAFHRLLAETVDAVHVMNPRTVEIVAPLYVLPVEKVVRIPHPSYAVEPDGAGARAGSATVRLLAFGEVRPYKGILEFARLVDRARRAGLDVELDVVGRVGGTLSEDDVREQLERCDGVRFEPGYVEPSRVPSVFGRADVLVLPYDGGLNSGVALLAASYGVPVIIGGSLRATWPLEPTWQLPLWAVQGDDGEDLHVLRDAVERVHREHGALRESALAAARERSPVSLAGRYADLFLPREG